MAFFVQITTIEPDNEETPSFPDVALLEFKNDSEAQHVANRIEELCRLASFVHHLGDE